MIACNFWMTKWDWIYHLCQGDARHISGNGCFGLLRLMERSLIYLFRSFRRNERCSSCTSIMQRTSIFTLHLFHKWSCSIRTYNVNISMHGTERYLWSKRRKDFQAIMITTRAEANCSRNNEGQWNPWSLWHTVNSGHYASVCVSLPCFLLSLSPPFVSLGDSGNEQKIPVMEAVWSFSVFGRNSLPWEKSSLLISTNCGINRRCQSALHTTHFSQTNLSTDGHNKAICI